MPVALGGAWIWGLMIQKPETELGWSPINSRVVTEPQGETHGAMRAGPGTFVKSQKQCREELCHPFWL